MNFSESIYRTPLFDNGQLQISFGIAAKRLRSRPERSESRHIAVISRTAMQSRPSAIIAPESILGMA